MSANQTSKILAQHLGVAVSRLRSAEANFASLGYEAPRLLAHATDLQFRGLSALAHRGNFQLAARDLGCSEPSLHRALTVLAKSLECRLWNRNTRGVDLTPAALVLAEGTGSFASEVRLGVEAAREAHGAISGELRIGALPTARPGWLPDALARTLIRHPESRVYAMDGPYEEQLAALRHGRIDMIIGALRPPTATRGLEQTPIFEDSLSIVVRADHPLARGARSSAREPSPARLGSLGWLLPPPGTPPRQAFDAWLKAKGLPPARCVLVCNSMVTIWSLLLATDFAAVIPASQCRSALIRGRLRTLGRTIPGSRHAIGLTTRCGFVPTRLQSTFIDELKAGIGAVMAG